MSWRFRKSFKVIPGVRLNLTARGLSATFGAAPFSVNVGPRGVYKNIAIPGTGIWDRQRIGSPSSHPHTGQFPSTNEPGGPSAPPPPATPPISVQPATEIRSASTELLTSDCLEQLRHILTDAYNERDELSREMSSATTEANTATRRFQGWERGFLLKRLFKRSFTTRKETAETATAKLEELQEQLRLTTIAIEITVDREQGEPYYRMRDIFAALSESQKIWNLLTETAIDRVAERSSAGTAVTRTPVPFSLNSCDLIQWEQKVPHLPNRTGGDMYIYPGFILYRASKQAFALIDSRDVQLRFVSTQFTEANPVPSDARIITHTWAKCNKDGTPDRRFRDNYQIPVVHYGTLLFSTADGLDVRYICSNAGRVEEFVKAWAAFRASLRTQANDGGEVASEKKEPGSSLSAFAKFNTAHDYCVAAVPELRKTNDQFVDRITMTGSGTMSSDDFKAYMAPFVRFIESAKTLCSETPEQFRSARTTFEAAIRAFEAARNHFEVTVSKGHLDTAMLKAYLEAAGTFFQGMVKFDRAITDATMSRGSKPQKRGVPKLSA